jgi:hypothetical protein
MKYIIKINIVLVFFMLLFSCTNNDKNEGTPSSNNQEIETIKGNVATTSTFALPGQFIDFTGSLPQDFVQKVDQDIDIEVLSTTLGGSLRKSIVKILKGQSTFTGKVLVGGGDGNFNMPVTFKLNAVKLSKEIVGKHYLLTSDAVSVASGNSSVPVDNDKRLQIRIYWENQTSGVGNTLKGNIARVNSWALNLKGSSVSTGNVFVGGFPFAISYVTDLSAAANQFVLDHKVAILAKGFDIVASGKSIIFNYSTPVAPNNVTISSVPATSTNIGGIVFKNDNVSAANSGSINLNDFFVFNSQLKSSSSSGFETGGGVYTEGNYKISVKPTFLDSSPINLKYRIIVKKPDNSVIVFNDVLNSITTATPAIDILSFTKTGYGDTVNYSNIVH